MSAEWSGPPYDGCAGTRDCPDCSGSAEYEDECSCRGSGRCSGCKDCRPPIKPEPTTTAVKPPRTRGPLTITELTEESS